MLLCWRCDFRSTAIKTNDASLSFQIIETLKSFDRLHERSVAELFELLQCLCSHSVSTSELKNLLSLLQNDENVDGEKDVIAFPYKSQVTT